MHMEWIGQQREWSALPLLDVVQASCVLSSTLWMNMERPGWGDMERPGRRDMNSTDLEIFCNGRCDPHSRSAW